MNKITIQLMKPKNEWIQCVSERESTYIQWCYRDEERCWRKVKHWWWGCYAFLRREASGLYDLPSFWGVIESNFVASESMFAGEMKKRRRQSNNESWKTRWRKNVSECITIRVTVALLKTLTITAATHFG
jgi:hypothetical protein